jgi:hypothetical protein
LRSEYPNRSWPWLRDQQSKFSISRRSALVMNCLLRPAVHRKLIGLALTPSRKRSFLTVAAVREPSWGPSASPAAR